MNFLAHLYLADNTPESLVGNMLADFVDSEFRNHYPEEISRGIVLHRKVDVFADRHPVFRRSKGRIGEEYRHLKGIMVDIFYDHFLAKNWPDYSALPLEDFCDHAYGVFMEYRALAPPRFQRMLPLMIAGNWLLSYRHLEGIARVLTGMSGRLSRKNRLAEGISELRAHYREFEADFREFFPGLVSYVEDVKRETGSVMRKT